METLQQRIFFRVATAFVICVYLAATANGMSPKRPMNVVFFLVDDLGWTDLGCYGSDFYQTPHIDQLAADGMKFTQNYSACNACSPTRGALMTGMYPARTHLTDWIPGWGKQYSQFALLPPKWKQHLEQKHTSLPEALHAAGYSTLHLGKWHLGGPGNLPEDHGFDINIGGSKRGLPASYHFPYGGAAMQWYSNLPESQRKERYLTDRLADEAVALIKLQKEKPFFMYFSFYSVHAPIQGRKDLMQKYKKLPAGKIIKIRSTPRWCNPLMKRWDASEPSLNKAESQIKRSSYLHLIMAASGARQVATLHFEVKKDSIGKVVRVFPQL